MPDPSWDSYTSGILLGAPPSVGRWEPTHARIDTCTPWSETCQGQLRALSSLEPSLAVMLFKVYPHMVDTSTSPMYTAGRYLQGGYYE